jgi:hypothetical protein
VDASRATWSFSAAVDRQSLSAQSDRTAMQETPGQTVRPDEQAEGRFAKTAEKQAEKGLS